MVTPEPLIVCPASKVPLATAVTVRVVPLIKPVTLAAEPKFTVVAPVVNTSAFVEVAPVVVKVKLPLNVVAVVSASEAAAAV